MISRTALALGVLLLPVGARLNADEATPEQVEFFEKRVRPILVNHCYRCHSKDAKKLRGELALDTREGLRKGGASGPGLVPGKPNESLLIQAVRHEGDLRMPPQKKLSPAEIADLVAWVKQGAADPRDGAVRPKQGIDLAAAKKSWAFQPVGSPTPPAVADAAWAGHPVDRFLKAKLDERGLRPVERADRRTLLRRVTFDLTGLPPTPEEVEAFLRDESPDAFAKVVDRLLASSAYGERWGRHWLDVVRYADTAGDNSDYPIPQMIKYRDWVIDAFNRDLPYDQFIRAQLAGDLLPATSDAQRRQQLIATGYLANARRFGSYEDARYPWHLTIEDTLDNLGKAFLGVTVGCARCHDHKFDPVSIEDYYGLYGFFSSTRYPWPGIELDKVPKDLVPLAPPAEVEKVTKARQQKLAGFDAKLKRLEGDKKGARGKKLDELNQAIKAARKEREQAAREPLPFDLAYAVIDGPAGPKKRIGQVGNVKVQLKGDPDRLGKEVPRRFPLVLGGQTLSPDVKGSGRLELANWIADSKNPLTARVLVNRVWHHHFGRGFVATPNNFGKQGRPPSHPELLDYLARRFLDSGWSMKALHRLVLTSRAYQLSSRDDAANVQADPENAYLWHYPRRRLDAESIRDTLLLVGGNLDRAPGGPHPFPDQKTWAFSQHRPFKAVYDSNRRSVYLMTQRIQRHPFLALFDGPDTNASTDLRTTSTTPLQALFLMNDPFVHGQSEKFAARLLAERSDDAARVERAFMLLFSRPPTAEEQAQARDYLVQVGERLASAGVPTEQRLARAWESLARALFMSSEFLYVD